MKTEGSFPWKRSSLYPRTCPKLNGAERSSSDLLNRSLPVPKIVCFNLYIRISETEKKSCLRYRTLLADRQLPAFPFFQYLGQRRGSGRTARDQLEHRFYYSYGCKRRAGLAITHMVSVSFNERERRQKGVYASR